MTHALTPADAEALAASFLEARRAKHADFRMDATDGGTDDGADDQTGGQPDGAPSGGAKPDDQTPAETPEEKAARLEAELAETKRHSRTWETRAKENKDKAKKWDEAETANATPDQKLTIAEKRAVDAETELARYKVAHATQLPAALLSLLNGDEDQMREQAQALLAFKGETPVVKPKPKPDPTQGGGNGTGPKPSAADEGKAEAQRRIAARQSRKS